MGKQSVKEKQSLIRLKKTPGAWLKDNPLLKLKAYTWGEGRAQIAQDRTVEWRLEIEWDHLNSEGLSSVQKFKL